MFYYSCAERQSLCRQRSSSLTMVVPLTCLPKDDEKLQKKIVLTASWIHSDLLLSRDFMDTGKRLMMKIGYAGGLCFSLHVYKEMCIFCGILCHSLFL